MTKEWSKDALDGPGNVPPFRQPVPQPTPRPMHFDRRRAQEMTPLHDFDRACSFGGGLRHLLVSRGADIDWARAHFDRLHASRVNTLGPAWRIEQIRKPLMIADDFKTDSARDSESLLVGQDELEQRAQSVLQSARPGELRGRVWVRVDQLLSAAR